MPSLACEEPASARSPGTGFGAEDESDTGGQSSESGELPDVFDEGDELPDDGDLGDSDPGDGDGGEDQPYETPLYPAGRVHSPISAFVRDNLGSIRALTPAAPAEVFMKVGASSTVSPNTLHCFADDWVELDVYEDTLRPSLDFYLAGQAGETTPFDRSTLAAQSGKTAGWAITGAPSPIEQELAAIHPDGPSLALVHYGANDMQMGLTYASALPGYFANMSDLLDLLIDGGVVPVVFGLSRRLDQPGADLWVQSYNALARGLAQARAIPFVDLHFALERVPGYGLSGDGLHLEAFDEGACVLTPEGLSHGYNVRNLIALEVLDRLRTALVEEVPISEEPVEVLAGDGSLDAPLQIPALPFADTRSTVDAPGLMFDEYTGCMAVADESGPENVYRLVLTEPTPIRALVLDRAGVDIDLHLLDDSASEAGCLARDDTMIERTLEPGTYYFSLDTYVNGQAVEQSGEYTFVVLACELEDTDCVL